MRRLAPRIALGLLVALVLLSGLAWADLVYVRAVPGGEWLLSAWGGSRAFVSQGLNPYDELAARPAQMEAYGRLATEGEYPYRLTQPFHLMLAFVPLGFISDLDIVRVIWILLTQLAGLVLAYLSLRLADWSPPRGWLVAFLLCAVLWLPAVAAFDGGPAIWQALWLSGAILALDRRREELAGALLALSALRWASGGLILLAILLWCLYRRRMRALAGFLMVQIVLIAFSLVLLPGWPLEYARSIYANLRAGGLGISLRAGLFDLWPAFGDSFAIILAVLLAVALVMEWRQVLKEPLRHASWTFALTLAAAPLISGRIVPSDLAGLLPALALVLAVAVERWPRGGRWLGALLLGLLFAGPWLWPYFRPDLPGVWLFSLPAVLLLALYWLRWWALRPPRTWLDQVASWKR